MKKKIEFTDRQMLILDMIAEEQSIREIARIFHCSETNIQHIRHRIRMKIGLIEGQSLKQWLYENGWDKPDFGDDYVRRYV